MNIGMQQVLSVSMQQRQQLVMTPAMVQAIRLLQLNSMELEQEINQEMEENPFLELLDDEEEGPGESDPDSGPDSEREESERAGEGDDLDIERAPDVVSLDTPTTDSKESAETDGDTPPDLLDKPDRTDDNDQEIEEFYQESYDDVSYATVEHQAEERDRSQLDSAGTTLYEHLMQQLHITDLEDNEFEVGAFLIGNIDDNGYLRNFTVEGEGNGHDSEAAPEGNEDILEIAARRFGIPRERVEEILTILQGFEPTGVAARSIAECLLIQIRSQPEADEALETIVRDHFDDMAHRRHKAIARAMKIPERRVVDLCQRVSHLEPKPGRAFTTDAPQYITPDVVVNQIGGKYYIALNEGRTNHLRVSSYYRSKFANVLQANRANRNGEEDPESEFIKKKFNDAVVLIRNIERRKGTILKIAQAIMERQSDFLEKGIEHLRPMTLKDIAAEVGMHEATVSRVTASKYVETPRGTFPLKYFFSSGLESDSGENQSSRSIRNRIQQMIEQEDPKKPLSDQRIADLIKAEGVRIARRTVTKYREQMKILPTNMRRES